MGEARARHHLDASDDRPRPRRGLLLAGLALLLVALVGLGSRAPLWDIGGPPRLANPDSYSGDLVLVGFVSLLVVPFIIQTILRQRRGVSIPYADVERIRPKWWVRLLGALAVAVAIGLSLFVITLLPGAGRKTPVHRRPGSPAGQKHPASEQRGPPVHWWGYTLVVLILAGGVATAFALRRSRAGARPAADEPDELLAAVDLSLDDVENDPDPRRAVIRAYGRMERALASYGLVRRPSETPLEYIGRALTSLRVGRASVERLSALFERAKFSQHEIDVSMKSDALAALGALRDELAGEPA
jgi:hypothetical protein